MVKMFGQKRVFDSSLINESDLSTSTLRKIDIYGIKNISELVGVLIPIQPVVEAVGEETQVVISSYVLNSVTFDKVRTELSTASLKVIKDGKKVSPTEPWTTLKSFYYLVYDGEDFIAFDLSVSGDLSNLMNTVKDIIDTKLPTKVDKSTFDDVASKIIYDVLIDYKSTNSEVSVIEKKINVKDGSLSEETTTLPKASEDNVGLMPSESFNQIIDNTTRIQALEQQGGRYIGVSFETYADLQKFKITADMNVGDFTFVLDDENVNASNPPTTRYIIGLDNGNKVFQFAYIINYDPITTFTNTVAGIIKGSTVAGKIFAENDGTGSVNGWDDLVNKVDNLKTAFDNRKYFKSINVGTEFINPTETADALEIDTNSKRLEIVPNVTNKKITFEFNDPTGAVSSILDTKLSNNKVLISDISGNVNASQRTLDELNTLEDIDTSKTIQQQINDINDKFGKPLKVLEGTTDAQQAYAIAKCNNSKAGVLGFIKLLVQVVDVETEGTNLRQEAVIEAVFNNDYTTPSIKMLNTTKFGYDADDHTGFVSLQTGIPKALNNDVEGFLAINVPDSNERKVTITYLDGSNWYVPDELVSITSDTATQIETTDLPQKDAGVFDGLSFNRTANGNAKTSDLSIDSLNLIGKGTADSLITNGCICAKAPNGNLVNVVTANSLVKLPHPTLYVSTSEGSAGETIDIDITLSAYASKFTVVSGSKAGDALYAEGELDENNNFKSSGVLTNKMGVGKSYLLLGYLNTPESLVVAISPRCYTFDNFGKLNAIDGQPVGGGSEFGIKNKIYETTGTANSYVIEDEELNLDQNNVFFMKPNATATGNSTLTVNGVRKPLTRFNNTPLFAGSLMEDGIYLVVSDTNNFTVVNSHVIATYDSYGSVIISDAIDSDSSGTVATSKAVKILKDLVDTNKTDMDGKKQDLITGAASTVTEDNLTAQKILVSNTEGKIINSETDASKLTYLNNLTGDIQSQLNNKQAKITGAATTIVSDDLTQDRVVISNENGKVVVSDITTDELNSLDGISTDKTIQQQFTDVNSSIAANSQEITTIKSNASTQSAKITAIENDITEVNQKITANTNNISSNTTEINTIKDDLADATTDINGLKTSVSTLNTGKVDKSSFNQVSNKVVSDIGLVSPSANVINIVEQKVNILDGTTEQETNQIPIADKTKAGLISKEDLAQITTNAALIASLSGRDMRFAIHLGDSINPTQEQLQAAYLEASGETGAALDGTTLLDLDNNKEYTWFSSNDLWNDRGFATVTVATNNSLGIVQGDATTAGKVKMLSNGTMEVNGFTDARNDIDDLQANIVTKQQAIKTATCDTAQGTTIKVITLDTPWDTVEPTAGDMFIIKFTNGNVIGQMKWDINGSGAKAVRLGAGNVDAKSGYFKAGDYALAIYNGTDYQLFGSQDNIDENTTLIWNVFNRNQYSYIIDQNTQFAGSGKCHSFFGLTSENTIDLITNSTSNTAGERAFTNIPINYNEHIFYESNNGISVTAGQPLIHYLFKQYNIGNVSWKYPIGQYRNKSGALVGNNVNDDLVQTPLYIGGVESSNGFFIPDEFALTKHDTGKVYKRIGWFSQKGVFAFISDQPAFKYIRGAWQQLGGGAGGTSSGISPTVYCPTTSSTNHYTISSEDLDLSDGDIIFVMFDEDNIDGVATLEINGVSYMLTLTDVHSDNNITILSAGMIRKEAVSQFLVSGTNLIMVSQSSEATTSAFGLVKLSDSITSNTTDAATSYAVKKLNDAKQEKITGAATTITSSDLTAERVLVSNASGKVATSTITTEELGYLSGLTSNIQEQLDNLPTNNSAYKTLIGDGSATSFVIEHNLNTRDVLVQIYDNSTYKDIHADIERTTVNSITISGFISAPTSNQYRVIVQPT